MQFRLDLPRLASTLLVPEHMLTLSRPVFVKAINAFATGIITSFSLLLILHQSS